MSFRLPTIPPINNLRDLIKISETFTFYENIDMPVLWKINPILKKLDDLVGMESLKDTLFCQIIYYVQGLHLQNKDEEFLHTILAGPPGTGKTTVAKIISELYSALGVLKNSTGRFKIAKREDFVASYLDKPRQKQRHY